MDSRKIKDFNHFDGDLDKLNKLDTVRYHLRNNESKEYMGLISQQLESIEPLLTFRTENGIEIDYKALSSYLLSCINQLHNRVQLLEKKKK